jgi:hypothetical protein
MNLAFGTLLIFLLVVPGIAFRVAYFHGEFSKKFLKTSAFDDFIWALIPGVIIQFLATVIIQKCPSFDVEVDIESLGFLLMGAKDDSNVKTSFLSIQNNLWNILIYNGALISISGISGYMGRKMVRRFKWDIKSRLFRFNNEWYYLMTGEIVNFPENNFKAQKIDFVHVDVLTKTSKELIIYSGAVGGFYLSKDGGLSSVLISQAKRRVMDEDGDANPEYYDIPGQFMLLKSEEIININFRYITFIPPSPPNTVIATSISKPIVP